MTDAVVGADLNYFQKYLIPTESVFVRSCVQLASDCSQSSFVFDRHLAAVACAIGAVALSFFNTIGYFLRAPVRILLNVLLLDPVILVSNFSLDISNGSRSLFFAAFGIFYIASGIFSPGTVFPYFAPEKLKDAAEELKEVKAEVVQLKSFSELKLPGIKREGNNCWANAALQFLFNVPSLQEKLLKTKGNTPIKNLFTKYKWAQYESLPIASQVDSSRLRRWLFPDSRNDQLDACDAVAEILNLIRYSIKTVEIISGRRSETVSSDPIIELDFKQLLGFESLESLVSNNFKTIDDKHQLHCKKILYLDDDFFIRVKRSVPGAPKIHTRVVVPFLFNFPREHVSEDVSEDKSAVYECSGAIIHEGENLNEGHYVSLIKKRNQWFLINDVCTTAVTNEQAQQYLSNAYVFNFRKMF